MHVIFLLLLDALQNTSSHALRMTFKGSTIQDNAYAYTPYKSECPLQFFLVSHHPRPKAMMFVLTLYFLTLFSYSNIEIFLKNKLRFLQPWALLGHLSRKIYIYTYRAASTLLNWVSDYFRSGPLFLIAQSSIKL